MESRNIFDYQLTGSEAGGDYDSDLLFYSRRIGSSPHASPALGSNEYVKMPLNTSILGAAKFSGKTRKGWSIGILESITQKEMATIDNSGEKKRGTGRTPHQLFCRPAAKRHQWRQNYFRWHHYRSESR